MDSAMVEVYVVVANVCVWTGVYKASRESFGRWWPQGVLSIPMTYGWGGKGPRKAQDSKLLTVYEKYMVMKKKHQQLAGIHLVSCCPSMLC